MASTDDNERIDMKIKTKQFVAFLIMVIFYSPFIYFGVIENQNNFNFGSTTFWWYLFGYISFPVIYFVLGKEIFQKNQFGKKKGTETFGNG